MSNSKVIHVHIYRPDRSIFKGSKNDRAECFVVECNNYKNCRLYEKGECVCINMFSRYCPYGKVHNELGFTKRATKYYNWIHEREKKYDKEVFNKLKSTPTKMAYVGDYVFLPYSHMNMNESISFSIHGHAFRSGTRFIPKESFTVENIINICEFIPMALMGGEIKSYQQEVVPKFIKHLSEEDPNLYKELAKKYERAKEIVKDYSYVGRKALLRTLTPNAGEFIDIHKGIWKWDGEYLTSTNNKVSFALVKKFSEIRIKPDYGEVVKINDNSQVNNYTIFVD